MNNQAISDILIKELNINSLPKEAQDQIVSKLGEIILKSITVAIFEKLSPEGRAEFELITESADSERIQEFVTSNVPDLPELMESEVKRVLQAFKEAEKENRE